MAARERILAASPPARVPPPGKTIADMVEGALKTDESDAEILAALARMS